VAIWTTIAQNGRIWPILRISISEWPPSWWRCSEMHPLVNSTTSHLTSQIFRIWGCEISHLHEHMYDSEIPIVKHEETANNPDESPFDVCSLFIIILFTTFYCFTCLCIRKKRQQIEHRQYEEKYAVKPIVIQV
jgi:hypothetical protein